jgi:pectin methylesterase-like acyl-CoA thioesterase
VVQKVEPGHNGAGIGGTIFSAGGWTGRLGTTTTSILATSFDGFELGYRPTTSTATTLQVNRVTVVLTTPVAPSITGLTNQTVIAGNSTTLAPTIIGAPTPAYQWQTNGVNIDGATNAVLALSNVQFAQDGWNYSLIATNSLGNVTNSMTLSVIVPPTITGLNDQAAATNDTVTMSPTVSGVPTPLLQWNLNGAILADGPTGNGSTISGSTSSTLIITAVATADAGTYSLVASNSAGIVTNSMNLTVSAGNVLPIITGPANITVIQGNNGTFSASASGLPLPTLQWLDQTGTPITAATNATLVLTNVQYSQNGYVYSVLASNTVGSATNSATLTVIVSPAITSQPSSLVVTNTQSASFTVGATGVPAPAFQWNKNGSPISGATSATYNIASVSPSDTATYSVTITNQAGTTNSVNATLTVNSIMAATAFSPTNGQTGVCYDTPLVVTFSQVPTLRTNGTIKIYNVTNSTTAVDTINLAASAVNGTQAHSSFPGDAQSFNYYPIVITGSTAKIYPHGGVLTSNQTYYVTIDYGAFADPSGASFAGITANNIWQFSTKASGAVDPVNPVVSADGSGDFVTVQGALDSLAVNAAGSLRTVNVKNGLYFELVNISGKTNVTLRGQSRAGTVIYYPNNATIAPGGTTHARMSFKVNANDVALDNLTISNSTPQGGAQAEALMIETSAKRCIINNCEIVSRQDTILANVNSSQGYFNNSTIKGNFDYIWGGGNLFFNKCTLQTIAGTGSGQLTAARTDTSASTSANFPWLNPPGTYTANGMSFVNCSFRSDPGLGNITLAGSNGTSNNLVSWFGCDFATNYVAPSATLFNGSYLFWQSANTMTNSPVTFPVLTTISGSDPRLLAATNIPTWFYGWTPQLTPNILTNPASQTVTAGDSTTFTVVATGIPDPTYQWLLNGTNLSGATSATLTLPVTALTDAGNYSVVVTTSAGTVTSSAATLTVNAPPNTAPVFTAPITGTNIAINVGVNLSVVCTATDSDTPAQTLTYALLNGPAGATINATNGTLTWRPTAAQANSTNPVSVKVADDGTPNLSATNSFTVSVNPLTQPNVDSAVSVGGQFTLTVSGQVGPDYTVQTSTDLTGVWSPLFTTNPAAMPFSFTDTNGALPMQFYRIVVGP